MVLAEAQSVSVNDNFVDIKVTATTTTVETAQISISDFDANTDVNLTVVLFEYPLSGSSSTVAHILQSVNVTTDAFGSGTYNFTPLTTDHTGVGDIIAVQWSNSSINSTYYESGGDYFVVEKIREEKTSDNQYTVRTYYFSANFDWNQSFADSFANDTADGGVNAYEVQIKQWNFTSPDPDTLLHYFIVRNDVEGSDNFDDSADVPSGCYQVDNAGSASGNDCRVCIRHDLESHFEADDIGYANQGDLLTVITAHEHFHNLQYALMESTKWGSWDTVAEGTARFQESVLSPTISSYNTTVTKSLVILEHNNYVADTSRELSSFSYEYALYWGYLFDTNNGINTIREIINETSEVGASENEYLAVAITNILNAEGGGHSSYDDSLRDFSEKVFEKDFSWGTYNGSDEVNWGSYLNDVSRKQPAYSNGRATVSGTVDAWAIEYINISNSDFNNTEVIFEGYLSSDFTVKALLRTGSSYTSEILSLDSNHDGHLIISDSNSYDEIVLVIIRFNITGSGAYIVKVNDLSKMELSSGWNLVSFPVLPATKTVSNVLSSISGSYEKIQTYNTDTGDWDTHDENVPSGYTQTLTTISGGKAYRIYMNQSDVLEYTGSAVAPVNISLYTGWNYLPWVGGTEAVTSALSSISGSYDKVQTKIDGEWETYDVNAIGFDQTLDYMKPGRGYHILMNSNDTLEVN